jgi:cell division protein FtsN
MAKDYKAYSSKKKKRKRNSPKRPYFWFTIAILLLLTVFALYKLDVYRHVSPVTKSPSKTSQVKKVKATNQTTAPTKAPIKFEFYNLLAKESVSIPAPNTSDAAAPVDNSQYIVQVASVRSFAAADQLKATLAMKGLKVEVDKLGSGFSIWYRVQIGPFSNIDDAFDAQNSLRKDNYDGIVKKIQ